MSKERFNLFLKDPSISKEDAIKMQKAIGNPKGSIFNRAFDRDKLEGAQLQVDAMRRKSKTKATKGERAIEFGIGGALGGLTGLTVAQDLNKKTLPFAVGGALGMGATRALIAPSINRYFMGRAANKRQKLIDERKKQLDEHGKEASVAKISALASAVESGYFGKEAQYALEGMTEAIHEYVVEDLTEKTASKAETDYNIYDENAARLARLNNLLRK